MSDANTADGVGVDRQELNPPVQEMRYSLEEMLAEVRLERSRSALGRELLDSSEIDKLFRGRRRVRSEQT
jgi:hypothetical protein